MYSVYQHWDPLKVCIVGRSYPPEFYSWIKVPHVRALFERIAIETEEDFQHVIKKLESFGVEVLRPTVFEETDPFQIKFMPEYAANNTTGQSKKFSSQYFVPPMTPRDFSVIIGNTFYDSFKNKPSHINDNTGTVHPRAYDHIIKHIRSQGNVIETVHDQSVVVGSMVSRIGKDLYFGTEFYNQDKTKLQKNINKRFKNTRNHIIDTRGHSDGTFCAVCPGLIISLFDVPNYQETFPGWEVVYLPGQSWEKVVPFLELKKKNHGKWWIPGFEHDDEVINVVEQWLSHWTGYVEETVFDVNMLIIDPKNVMVFNHNKQVFDALGFYGITPHIVPFRHRYFWDGGIHCITSDLHREGTMQDYFPQRG